MKTWKALALVASLISTQAMASLSYGPSAEDEFLDLKATGEWTSYIAEEMYAMVGESDFVALESARSETRTCVYGFWLGEETPAATYSVKTNFLCFDKDAYELHILSEACAAPDICRQPDPTAISVGIGNIRVAEPTLQMFPKKNLPSILGSYPEKLGVQVTAPSATGLAPSVHQKIEDLLNGGQERG